MEPVAVQLFIIGLLFITRVECQEFMTLNVPSRPPFGFHTSDELAMDLSEVHPVFLYASSQNDFIHQNRPDRVASIPKKSHQQQHSIPRPKFINSPSSVSQNQRNNNKPRNTPPLTYGFQPKPSTNRQINNHQRPKEIHHVQQTTQQNDRFRGRRPQEPVYQASVRHGTQHQSKFSENSQVQSNVHQKQQNSHAVSNGNYQASFADNNAPFIYHSHGAPEKQFSSQASNHHAPSTRNQGYRNTAGENRNPINNQGQQNHQKVKEHRQESLRKPTTFENTAQVYKSRYNNNQANEGNFPQKVTSSYSGQNLPERNQNNERMNMQHHARSMRGDNKPQLPPRPPFSNGGIRINTLAGELPILHLDSLSTLNENPTIYLQNNNRNDQSSTDDQEKKTYLLIKAPPLVTTERPLSAPFVVESLKQTTSPYVVDTYEETNIHTPEITYSTPVDPRTLPEKTESPPIVLDLVQIPDRTTYNHHQQEKHFPQSVSQPEFRSAYNEHRDNIETIHPTESYPTTPLQSSYHDFVHHHHVNDAYSSLEHNPKYQNKVLPKPKIKEFRKSSNFSSLHPISYSSSVSVVSVKQSVDAKQPVTKKQKTPLKKVTTVKKKPKIPENDDYAYDYYGDEKNVPGEPGVDYPTHKEIPTTHFECKSIKSPGFYADVETGCQVFHNCDTGMAKHSFMCPNGTIFHQELFICDWWYNVKCEDSPEFYSLNSGLFITDNAHDEYRRKA